MHTPYVKSLQRDQGQPIGLTALWSPLLTPLALCSCCQHPQAQVLAVGGPGLSGSEGQQLLGRVPTAGVVRLCFAPVREAVVEIAGARLPCYLHVMGTAHRQPVTQHIGERSELNRCAVSPDHTRSPLASSHPGRCQARTPTPSLTTAELLKPREPHVQQ